MGHRVQEGLSEVGSLQRARRSSNATVHGGQSIEETEARESVEAVVAVWEWLNAVANVASARGRQT